MVIAIDPGKSGGCVVASPTHLEAIPWKGAVHMATQLDGLPIQRAYIERVYGTSTLTHGKVFEFGRNLGQWEGILTVLSVDLSYVKPQTWQWPLRVFEKNYNKRKSALRKIAVHRFGDLGKVTLATCDAWLLLEWAIKTDPLCHDLELKTKP